MHPILAVGPLPIIGHTVYLSTYLVVRAVYLLVAPWLALRLLTPLGFSRRDVLVIFLIGIPAGVVGAHLLAIGETGGYLARDVGRPDAWTGRSAIFGGIFAGVAVAALYTTARGLPLLRFLDGCAPVIALGEAVTRIGCFTAGCCFGRPTASFLGVTFPRATEVFAYQALHGLIRDPHATRSLPVHPTQLYAAAFAFVLAGVLLYVLRRRPHADGTVFALFLFSYAAWRFLLVYLRADSGPPVMVGLYTSQLWSIGAALIAVAIAVHARRAPHERRGVRSTAAA